jgi:hypothetical protein
MKTRKIHFNKSQLEAALIDPNIGVFIWPRGDGKTQGLLARKIVTNVFSLPRSTGVLCQPTFEGMLTNTLPSLVAGLANLGYYRDVHYVIGKRPNDSWKKNGLWQDPYQPILKPDHIIHWFNGSAILLVSFNRSNSANGQNIDWIMNDESKFTVGKIKERFDNELIPAMRGNRQHFEGDSCYQSITFATDQPNQKQALWLYDYENLMDLDQIEVIRGLQYAIAIETQKLKGANPKQAVSLSKKIQRHRFHLNEARLGSVFYHEPEPLANLEVLGEETYKRFRRVLPENIYRSSILNERVVHVENPFYPNLNDEIHVVNYPDNILENKALNSNYDLDVLNRASSLHDADISPDRPLDIALDWGDRINVLVVGQGWTGSYHISNAMFVKKPKRVQDLIQDFCNYYKDHKYKLVNLPYDQTAYFKVGFTHDTYLSEVKRILRANKWAVNDKNVGAVRAYEYRYLLWDSILTENDSRFPKYRFNGHNCQYLLTSMHAASTKQGKNGFEKDKSSERNSSPQEEATHFSDAVDTLAVFRHGDVISGKGSFSDTLFVSS